MNVIWIISDTVRRDHLGCYGNQTIHTPSIDYFASKSMRFDRHYASDFPTMPTRADFLTGRWTGCFMKWEPLPSTQETIGQLLSKAGIHTAAVVDTPFYSRDGMNYDRGFRSFIEIAGQEYWMAGIGDDIRKTWRHESDRFAPRTFIQAEQWLEKHYKEDFFLYIDIWDPHEPWDAPEYYTELYWSNYDGEIIDPPYCYWQDVPKMTEEKMNKAHATYCGELTMVDTWIGHFMRKLENMDLLENTAVIFTTDHGFYFGEHGGLFGKMTRLDPSEFPYWLDLRQAWTETSRYDASMGFWTYSPLYEELISCPLLIYIPNITPGSSSALTSAADLMPTVLDIFGQEIPPWVEGNSLLPILQEPENKGRTFTVSTHPFSNPMEIVSSVDGQKRIDMTGADTTVTTDEWSLLYCLGKVPKLYHLPTDPKQENDVAVNNSDVVKNLHQLLLDFMHNHNVASSLIRPRLELKL